MKGYIAFCPHFHQPHFQLYKTREEAFINSYQPWLELLQESVGLEHFFINLHFSGPFLYWFREQKPAYLRALKSLLDTRKIGLIGGLADEPFIQLSSRSDDYLYQLKMYDELCHELFGIKAQDWQGIHLVERECGEALFSHVTRAARLMGAPPIYYLDAETFYQSHFSLPGGMADFCLKHFGFKDPYSLTTVSHIPEEMLYFGLRDEIDGQVFYAVPVHTQFRYQLLKRNSFTPEDKIRIKPAHYFFYIKDALEQAARLASKYGREISPIMLIFEDAEKMGQWSKDPQGDKQWLMEFFHMVNDDPDIDFIGLRDYMDQVGILDSYPVASSHCYPEWENWTAKRGIRGVTFSDERLRRVISRLRLLETMQERFEKMIIAAVNHDPVPLVLKDMQTRAMMQSLERFEIVNQLLLNHYPAHYAEYYQLINRVRNLVYQEDPKWASRHPSYGSSPYYDMQGLAYLEIADRLLRHLLLAAGTGGVQEAGIALIDWDFDGRDEIVLYNLRQSLAIDLEGGCVHYHHVLADHLAEDEAQLATILRRDFAGINAYHSVYRHAYPLVMTETDSSLKAEIFPEGARKENCRNALRCNLMIEEAGNLKEIGDFDQSIYQLEELEEEPGCSRVLLSCTKSISTQTGTGNVKISKEYILKPDSLSLVIGVRLDNIHAEHIYLVPQVVSSAAASDEVDFRPVSYLGLPSGEGEFGISIHDVVSWNEEGISFTEKLFSAHSLNDVDYVYWIKAGNGDLFANRIRYHFSGSDIEKMEVRPAVAHYYQDLVFAGQSRLGYQSSGLMLLPFIALQDGETEFRVDMNWELDFKPVKAEYQQRLQLIDNDNAE